MLYPLIATIGHISDLDGSSAMVSMVAQGFMYPITLIFQSLIE